MDAKCRLVIATIVLGYIVYVIALFSPKLGDYVAKASLAVLIGILAYLYARYRAAQCSRVRSRGEEITRTPVG